MKAIILSLWYENWHQSTRAPIYWLGCFWPTGATSSCSGGRRDCPPGKKYHTGNRWPSWLELVDQLTWTGGPVDQASETVGLAYQLTILPISDKLGWLPPPKIIEHIGCARWYIIMLFFHAKGMYRIQSM